MRRKALLDACREKMSGQTFANCLRTLERQGVVQVKRGKKHVDLTLNYGTDLYPLKTWKEWSDHPPTAIETPTDLFKRVRSSYQQLLSDLRQSDLAREKALERIDLYLALYLNPQLRKHRRPFGKRIKGAS